MKRIFLAVLAAALLAGCTGDSSTGTSVEEGITGRWAGTYGTAGTLNWQLVQSGTSITGYEIGAPSWRTIEGSISGNAVTLTIDHIDGFSLTLSDDGGTLSGTCHYGESPVYPAVLNKATS
jgi:hypothetical protein